MTFAREKRLLLGAAALLVALPLPLNLALEWPVLGLFLAAVALFLRRAWLGAEKWLSNRALNLLGLAYLPVMVLDFASTGRVQFVRPILHLTLFGLTAKLWSLGRERDKWQAWIGIFFLFLAAMSTSTHPSVVVYLLAFLVLAIVLMVRFVHLHVLSTFGAREGEAGALPVGRFVLATVLATILFAVPLFALLPRVRTPFVLGPGGVGSEPSVARAGFSDEMSLDQLGRIRDNPAIALRLRFEGRVPRPETLRLKAAAYDVWEGRSWRQTRGGRDRRRDSGSGMVRFVAGQVEGRAHVTLEPLRSRSLIVPVETVAVEFEGAPVAVDEGGALVLPGTPSLPVEYEAFLGARPLSLAPAADLAKGRGEPLDPRGISPRIAALAAEWAASGSDAERASRIERHLLEEYGYTSVLVGRGGEAPIEEFLFEARRGHCEYFASAMVLLLRAQGIPARVVTGFYGAEWSPWESAWVVRQSNAHAWVEAWLRGEGWRIFDPTPPDGRPVVAPRSLKLYVRQAWEAVLFRWDRWVISYDFEDQVSVLGELRARWDRWLARLFGKDRTPEPAAPAAAPAGAATPGALAAEQRRWTGWAAAGAVAALAAAIGSLWAWRRHTAWSATFAYARLRSALAGAGLPVRESTPPLALAALAGRRIPAAAPSVRSLVDAYLRETFAGEALDESALAPLRRSLTEAEGAARAFRRRSRGRA